jgi:hypothetical protein
MDQLVGPLYCRKRSVGASLSHLGSQDATFGLVVDSVLSGTEPPEREAHPKVWALHTVNPNPYEQAPR